MALTMIIELGWENRGMGGGVGGQAFRLRGVRLSFDGLEACEP